MANGTGWETIKQVWGFLTMVVGGVFCAIALYAGAQSFFMDHSFWNRLLSVVIFLWGGSGIAVLIYFLFFRPQHRR